MGAKEKGKAQRELCNLLVGPRRVRSIWTIKDLKKTPELKEVSVRSIRRVLREFSEQGLTEQVRLATPSRMITGWSNLGFEGSAIAVSGVLVRKRYGQSVYLAALLGRNTPVKLVPLGNGTVFVVFRKGPGWVQGDVKLDTSVTKDADGQAVRLLKELESTGGDFIIKDDNLRDYDALHVAFKMKTRNVHFAHMMERLSEVIYESCVKLRFLSRGETTVRDPPTIIIQISRLRGVF